MVVKDHFVLEVIDEDYALVLLFPYLYDIVSEYLNHLLLAFDALLHRCFSRNRRVSANEMFLFVF